MQPFDVSKLKYYDKETNQVKKRFVIKKRRFYDVKEEKFVSQNNPKFYIEQELK